MSSLSARVKRFALVSLLGAVVMLGAFIVFSRHLSEQNLIYHHEIHNQVLARIFANSLEHHGLQEVLGVQNGKHHPGGGYFVDRDVRDHFDQTISEHIRDLPIVKVKLYNLEGVTVYSLDSSEVGRSAERMDSFRSAIEGNYVSKMVFWKSYKVGKRILNDLYMMESYIPIEVQSGETIGVFEIYSDATHSVHQAEILERRIIWGSSLILGTSYAILFMLFYRTDRVLQREQKESDRYLKQVEEAKENLERRVRERTAELESSKYFLQSIIDGIADPVMVISMDLKVTEMNLAAKQLKPKNSADEEFTYCYQISHRNDAPCSTDEHPCSFNEVLRENKPCKLLHIHYDAAGERRYVEVVSTPFRDVHGEMAGIVEACHDVTDVVEARNRLQASEQQIRAVMDTVDDAILTIDEQGVIRDANLSAEQMFGYLLDELVGKQYATLLPRDHDSAVAEKNPIAAYLKPMVFAGAQESSALRKDGKVFPVEIWVGELNFDVSTIYIAVFHDISERKHAAEELEKTRQQYFHQEKMAAIGQLAAGILHEVGNPIAAISGSIQAIHDTHGQDECATLNCPLHASTSQHLTMIESQVNRLAAITREIADFASPRPGMRELLDLNSLIRSTASLMNYDRRLSQVSLELDLDPQLPAITAVADKLTQVLMNLVINAVDACEQVNERDSVIRITTQGGKTHLNILVEDNGTGMSDEVISRATEAFFTTKPATRGTGLGLSLCNSITTEHQGEFTIHSEIGEGTRITISLPLDGASKQELPADEST